MKKTRRPNDSQLDWLWNKFNDKLVKGEGFILTESEINRLLEEYTFGIESRIESDIKKPLDSSINSKIDLKLSNIVEDRILPIIDDIISEKLNQTQEDLEEIKNNLVDINSSILEYDGIFEDVSDYLNKINEFKIKFNTLNSKVSLQEIKIDNIDNYITDLSNLSPVAQSGSYNDLSNKPVIPSNLYQLSTDETHRVVTDLEKINWNGKQDPITTVNVTVGYDNNTNYPYGQASIDGSIMSLNFLNIKGEKGETGATGPQGENFQPIEDVSGLVLAQDIGTDTTKAMSQKGVTDAVVITGSEVLSSSLTSHNCSLGNNAKWYRNGSSGPQSHVAYRVTPGQELFLTPSTSAGSFYGFLASSYSPEYNNGSATPYVSGTDRMSFSSTATKTITIPAGCAWLILTTYDGSGNTPSWTIQPFERLKKRIADIEDACATLKDKITVAETINLTNYNILDWIIQNNNLWGNGLGRWQCKLIDISKYKGDELVITRNTNGNTYYALLKSTTRSNNSTPDWASGYNAKVTISSSNSPLTVTIPSDANYLYLYVNADGTNVEPSVYMKRSVTSTLSESLFKATSRIDVGSLELQACSLGTSSWYDAGSGKQCHVAVPVTAGEIVRLRGADYGTLFYGLLSSSYSPPYANNDAIPYASGESRKQANISNPTLIQVPQGCSYIALALVDGSGNPSDFKIEKGMIEEELVDSTLDVPIKFRVAHWNLGHFALGADYNTAVTHETYAAMRQKWAEKINAINADIFLCCEYNTNFVEASGSNPFIRARHSVFKPYANAYVGSKPSASSYMQAAIFSNVEMKTIRTVTYTNAVQTGRYYMSSDLYIGNTLIKFVETHLDWDQGNNGAIYRAQQEQKLITDFADYPYVIIAGDFNIGSGEEVEYDQFTAAGYTMLNHGYLGEIRTYPAGPNPTGSLDNILCKGFTINGINIVNDPELSDHCCIYADFTLIR